jgi:hypothetical protein
MDFGANPAARATATARPPKRVSSTACDMFWTVAMSPRSALDSWRRRSCRFASIDGRTLRRPAGALIVVWGSVVSAVLGVVGAESGG